MARRFTLSSSRPPRAIWSQYRSSTGSPRYSSSHIGSLATVLTLTTRSKSRMASENTSGGTSVSGIGTGTVSTSAENDTFPVMHNSTGISVNRRYRPERAALPPVKETVQA